MIQQLRRLQPYTNENERPKAPAPKYLRASRREEKNTEWLVDSSIGPTAKAVSPTTTRKPRKRAAEPAADTWEDQHIAGKIIPAQPPRRFHPLFWIGFTVVVIVLLWLGSTNGVAFLVTHLSDPGIYGPTHGNVMTGVFGGGDSQAAPSKLIGLNDDGQTEIIYLHANDLAKSQIISGPDLRASNFTDPQAAEVQLETGDFNHDGHLDVKVVILSDVYDWPFHRFQSQPFYLYGDGAGHFTHPQMSQQTIGATNSRGQEVQA
jgi:hypothetical protein